MNTLRLFLNQHLYTVVFAAVLGLALTLRVVNLNYNVAFNDEAIYIVVGRMGVFDHDWYTYNPAAWIAGYPRIYPSLTAIAYVLGGLWGSRFLNVLFGVGVVALVWLISIQLAGVKKTAQQLAVGMIAAGLIGGSAVSLYVSRLATYDIPSFGLFLLSFWWLLQAQAATAETSRGRWYLLAGFTFVLAVLMKIVIWIYVPMILWYSWYKRGTTSREQHYWWWYYIVPVVAVLGIYLATNLSFLLSYGMSQTGREWRSWSEIWEVITHLTKYVWPLWVWGSLGMWRAKLWKQWLGLATLGVSIVGFHLLAHRVATLDKHLLILEVFGAMIAGIGIERWLRTIVWTKSRGILLAAVVAIVGLFTMAAYDQAQAFNRLWLDSSIALEKLQTVVEPGDKVLAEVGSVAILSLYEINFPTNTTTFDWLEYDGLQGQPAYGAAVRDGYFKWLLLEKRAGGFREIIHGVVMENLGGNYGLMYEDEEFEIYTRRF